LRASAPTRRRASLFEIQFEEAIRFVVTIVAASFAMIDFGWGFRKRTVER
jgi:hypothetical protein